MVVRSPERRVHKSWYDLLAEPYHQAVERGEICADLNLNSLLSWCSRHALSYAQHPTEQTDEELRLELERIVILGIKARD